MHTPSTQQVWDKCVLLSKVNVWILVHVYMCLREPCQGVQKRLSV